MRTILAMFVVAGLGVSGYLMAGDGLMKKGCPLASATKAGGTAACCAGAKTGEELAAYPSYQRAGALLKSWQEVPAKLAAMSDAEKTEIHAAFEKMHKLHPGAEVFMPTGAFLSQGLATLTEMDSAMAKMCGSQCSTGAKETASADGAKAQLASAEELKIECPVAAAAIGSAVQKMHKSAALVAKANEIALVAFQPMAEKAGCADKSACPDAAAKLTSGEGAKSSCCAEKSATVASTDSKDAKAKLASGEAKCDAACPKAAAAATVAAAGEKSCCAVKTLTAKAEALVAQSGTLTAQWQGAGIRLVAMDKADRDAVDKAASEAMSRCPMGSRMPESMETIAALLRDAVTLQAQARAECEKHADALAKVLTPEAKQLCEARMNTIAAMLNVLEKCNGTMRPNRQVASVD